MSGLELQIFNSSVNVVRADSANKLGLSLSYPLCPTVNIQNTLEMPAKRETAKFLSM